MFVHLHKRSLQSTTGLIKTKKNFWKIKSFVKHLLQSSFDPSIFPRTELRFQLLPFRATFEPATIQIVALASNYFSSKVSCAYFVQLWTIISIVYF